VLDLSVSAERTGRPHPTPRIRRYARSGEPPRRLYPVPSTPDLRPPSEETEDEMSCAQTGSRLQFVDRAPGGPSKPLPVVEGRPYTCVALSELSDREVDPHRLSLRAEPLQQHLHCRAMIGSDSHHNACEFNVLVIVHKLLQQLVYLIDREVVGPDIQIRRVALEVHDPFRHGAGRYPGPARACASFSADEMNWPLV
jgi:hypothetical protein